MTITKKPKKRRAKKRKANANKPTLAVRQRSEIIELRRKLAHTETELSGSRAALAMVVDAVHTLLNAAHDHETGEECPF